MIRVYDLRRTVEPFQRSADQTASPDRHLIGEPVSPRIEIDQLHRRCSVIDGHAPWRTRPRRRGFVANDIGFECHDAVRRQVVQFNALPSVDYPEWQVEQEVKNAGMLHAQKPPDKLCYLRTDAVEAFHRRKQGVEAGRAHGSKVALPVSDDYSNVLETHAITYIKHDPAHWRTILPEKETGCTNLGQFMTGTRRTTIGLDVRRRKALYQAWHRGTREMDLLLGRFADHTIDSLSDCELSEFETLMTVPDQELYAWLCGRKAPSSDFDTGLLRRIIAFHTTRPAEH